MRKQYFLVSAALAIPTGALFTGCTKNDNPIVNPDQPKPNGDGKYNIVFITCDQEAYMEHYPAGSDYAARERLRQIGTTFEKHYACANVSTSSRSVIYTGRHITETCMLDNTNYAFVNDMPRDLPTIGDMLRQAGYYTAFKGKWHVSKDTESLEDYGFSDWTEGDMYGSVYEGWHEDGTICDNSIEWLRTKGKALNEGGQSFFLAVNFLNPHDIMYYNEDGIGGLAGEGVPAPDDPVYKKSYDVALPTSWNEPLDKPGRPQAHTEYYYNWERMVGPTPKTADSWKRFRDYYYNTIQDEDNHMLRLLNYLSEAGLMHNTIIIYTSDHGELQGAHAMKGKGGNIYENNIHVPLIVYHPEIVGGRHCRNLTSHLDLAPTVIDYATNGNQQQFQQIAGELHGHSLVPAVKDPSINIRNNEGALFTFEMLSMLDSAFILNPAMTPAYRADLSKRGFVRGIITPEYKMARYFSPLNFNTPTTYEALWENNDVEVFVYGGEETENLAWPKGSNESIVTMMNQKLNALIEHEIGTDDGHEVRQGGGYKGGIGLYNRATD
ncbi:MAG: sulfatase-like hydrolase/transferase [Prevotella sp.]|nr:sulfatase-like hydrolase/transferase [Prevotella sp.]